MTANEVSDAVAEFRQATRATYPSLAFAFQPISGDLPSLLPEEAALLSPNAVPKRRSEFQAGRSAARTALRHFGVPPLPIGKGDKGQPLWPNGIVGSITHTQDLAIAVVGQSSECDGIGIDLELEQRFKPELAEAILTRSEMENVKAHGGDWGAYFSAKEATYKGIFGTIRKVIGFQDVELSINQEDGAFQATAVSSFSPNFPLGNQFLQGHIFRSNGMILSISVFSLKCGEMA